MRRRPIRAGILTAIVVAAVGGIARSQDELDDGFPAPVDRAVEYVDDVRPILAAHCYRCHGPAERKGGLRLDSRPEALAGGDSGPAFTPGNSLGSELVFRITESDPTVAMPPEGDRLGAEEVGILRAWIDQGAAWPEGVDVTAGTRPGADHWAFRPVERPVPPGVSDASWPRNPIDRFVLYRLEKEGIRPAPEADRRTLIRRLSLDLLGLPPAPEAVEGFVADGAPDAYGRLVDRLLASPHFGERWGRHWLDLARYADSDGYEKDSPRPYAYRYRDWVINAINEDMPFDRFSIEQLAGDLLPDATIAQKTATGFHRNTLTNKEGGVDPEEFRVAAVVDRVNTTGTVWLGLTVGCAQCHTHKYDPITQREYYGLFAFFNTSDEVDLPALPPGSHVRTLAEPTEDLRSTHVLIRGDFLRPGEEVEPGTPAVLPPLEADGPDRLDLARWLVDPENPLTARVAVNRTWHHLFGRALVPTLEDFGTRGEPPSHPELLDWLASEYVRLGWSRKALIRRIVTSATYRQSSATRPELVDRDPNNALLARQNRFRPEAEVIRDLFLAASGLLAEEIGGPSVRPPQPPGISDLTYAGSAKWVESEGRDRHRRGMYTWFQRTSPYPMLMTFDAPDANVCAVGRERSNTPLQALTLLNDEVFVECARAFAARILRESQGSTLEDRLRFAFAVGLARPPDDTELSILTGLHDSIVEQFRTSPESATELLSTVPPEGIAPAEAATWVVLARAILNLDEFVTRD